MAWSKYSSRKQYENSHYKHIDVMIAIDDHLAITQHCRENGLSMSGYVYELIIKDMAAKGVKLQGTTTRNVDDIISDTGGDNSNNTSAD